MTMYKITRHFKVFLSAFSRKKENGFNYIISLGYNCEVTYRFLKFFKFEESGLFNWTYSRTIDDLIFAINNFDKLGMNGFDNPNPLWECKNTHIRFHGKEDMGTYLNHLETKEILEKDLKELEGRIRYLKNKFINIAQSSESKLFIYKIKKDDITNDVENRLLSLHKALTNIGAKNFKLLIVQEKTNNTIATSPFYIVREVNYFAPDDAVTDKKYFNNGWDDIYTEFYPNQRHIRNKIKKYKFDKNK